MSSHQHGRGLLGLPFISMASRSCLTGSFHSICPSLGPSIGQVHRVDRASLPFGSTVHGFREGFDAHMPWLVGGLDHLLNLPKVCMTFKLRHKAMGAVRRLLFFSALITF